MTSLENGILTFQDKLAKALRAREKFCIFAEASEQAREGKFERIEQVLNKLENAGDDLNKGKKRKTDSERHIT